MSKRTHLEDVLGGILEDFLRGYSFLAETPLLEKDVHKLTHSISEALSEALMSELSAMDARKVDRGNEAYNPNAKDFRMGFGLAQSNALNTIREFFKGESHDF